jgi:hypothetical protein
MSAVWRGRLTMRPTLTMQIEHQVRLCTIMREEAKCRNEVEKKTQKDCQPDVQHKNQKKQFKTVENGIMVMNLVSRDVTVQQLVDGNGEPRWSAAGKRPKVHVFPSLRAAISKMAVSETKNGNGGRREHVAERSGFSTFCSG